MKLRINNRRLSLLIVSSFMLASALALALTNDKHNDNQQQMRIDSALQVVDMAKNTVTLTGDVVVNHESINICADKVVITRPDGKDGNEVVEGYGNPVTFYQLQDDGKTVRGHAQEVRYETANELVILTSNAYMEYLDSNVRGDCIIYLIKKQQMEAFSDKGKRVTTVLVPAQLHDKR